MIEVPVDVDDLLPFNRITALKIADAADRFESQCVIRSSKGEINVKSILGIMSLKHGNDNHLCISGADEEKACEAILALFKKLKNKGA